MSTEMETVQLRSKATPRQEANRKNAQKSTGPRTIEGKEASSQNATKHGLCANRNVIRTESQEEYDTFRDEMIADIAPAGAMELMLAERIVSLSWRLKRAEHFQNSAMNALIERDLNDSGYGWNERIRRQAKDEAAEGDFDLILGISVNIDFSRNKILEQLLAYEHRIESRLYRAIAELKKMQAIRRKENENVALASSQCSYGNQQLIPAQSNECLHGQDAHATSILETEKKNVNIRHEKEAVVESNDEHILQNEPNPSSLNSFAVTCPTSLVELQRTDFPACDCKTEILNTKSERC